MLRNIILAIITRGTVAITMLLNLVIISKFLGSAVLGQISLVILNMAIVHTVAEVYSGSALVYFIPRHSLASVYRKGLFWIFVCTVTVNVILLLTNAESGYLWRHVSLLSFISALHIFHNFLLLGREKIRIYNFLIFFQPVCNVVALIILVFGVNYKGLNAALMALYISYTIALLFSGIAVLGTVRACTMTNTINLAAVIKLGFMNQLGNLSHMLSNRYNYYFIGALGMGLLGVYSGATSLIESVWVISAGISPIVLTHIANLRDEKNNASLTFLLARISFLLTAVCVFVIWLIPSEFYEFLLGKDFSAARDIMLYLSPGVLAIGFSSILSHYFSGLGAQKVQLAANASGLLITLAFSYYMIQRHGLKGACIVASAAYIMQALVLTIVFMKRNGLSLLSFFALKSASAEIDK